MDRNTPNISNGNSLSFPFSAVIVLANLMDQQGNLNEESRARIDTAVSAFKNKDARFIVTTGWAYRDDSPIVVAEAMRKHVVEQFGIPYEAVIADMEARDTVGDAVFTKRNLAIPRGWFKLLVVTSQYHVERTKEIFSFIYGPRYDIQVRGAPSLDTEGLRQSEQRSIEAFRSTFQNIVPGDDTAIYHRLCENHPFYNGQIYPKYFLEQH